MVVLLLGAVLLPFSVFADCGSIPFYTPVFTDLTFAQIVGAAKVDIGKTSVDFDPLKVTVFEPKQRGIILWNGEEQRLLLSTDQKASERTAVLEVIPLPSEPTVRLGSFETFEKAQRLVVEKRTWVVVRSGGRTTTGRGLKSENWWITPLV